MKKLSLLETISVKFKEKLKEHQIEDQSDLLDKANSPAARQKLSLQTEINLKLLTKWVCEADLSRIDGIGPEYAQLLVESDIRCVQALKNYQAQKLQRLLKEINEGLQLVRNLPSEQVLQTWIDQAKKQQPILTF